MILFQILTADPDMSWNIFTSFMMKLDWTILAMKLSRISEKCYF